MLTLARFRELADSYGGDLQRWPQEARGEAQALLSVSPEARASLEEARALDDVIAAASTGSDAAARRISEDKMALARLRSGVAARIAAPMPRHHSASWRFARASSGRENGYISTRLNWVGMATGSSLAVIAGFLIGALYASAPASDAVLGMLQPIHILAE
jgi:hypothetical protein